jgi:hypothetical protein
LRRLLKFSFQNQLLDFGFFEINMFAYNRVIFPHGHFFGHGAAVLFGNIKEASVCCRKQFDFDSCGLRHDKILQKSGMLAKQLSDIQCVVRSLAKPYYLSTHNASCAAPFDWQRAQ